MHTRVEYGLTYCPVFTNTPTFSGLDRCLARSPTPLDVWVPKLPDGSQTPPAVCLFPGPSRDPTPPAWALGADIRESDTLTLLGPGGSDGPARGGAQGWMGQFLSVGVLDFLLSEYSSWWSKYPTFGPFWIYLCGHVRARHSTFLHGPSPT